MQDAKARFAELVRSRLSPTWRGRSFPWKITSGCNREVLVDHLFASPKLDDNIVDMINERPRDMGRDIEF